MRIQYTRWEKARRSSEAREKGWNVEGTLPYTQAGWSEIIITGHRVIIVLVFPWSVDCLIFLPSQKDPYPLGLAKVTVHSGLVTVLPVHETICHPRMQEVRKYADTYLPT